MSVWKLNIQTATDAIIAVGGRNSDWSVARSAEQMPESPRVIKNVGKTSIKIDAKYTLQYLNVLRCGVAASLLPDIDYYDYVVDI